MDNKCILVTGGAGYIGSFMVERLINDGFSVVVVDNLSHGRKEVVHPEATFREGELNNGAFLEHLFLEFHFDCVIHFAGLISVEESMKHPGIYFLNNVTAAVKLLDTMVRHNVHSFIFSSTGTVYGKPKMTPIPESHITHPENPYAETKLMVEKILHWYSQTQNLNYAVLRYFNACGAALDGSKGENHNPETHIIPNAIRSAIQNKVFTMYGDDYSTPDGTCIRDYIHVLDLVEAHVLSLQKLEKESGEFIYNVGTGKGYSNKEIVHMVKKISGIDFPITVVGRRQGDTEVIIADTTKIIQELGFVTRYSDLETIIHSAWEWHSKQSA